MFTITEMIVGLWFFPVLLCIVTPLAILAVWSAKQVIKKFTASILQKDSEALISFQAQSA
jgi:hypothetical protein